MVQRLPASQLDLAEFDRLLDERPKLVAFTHMSNVLGTINPVTELTRMAHAAGAPVLLDGCQAIVHQPVDVKAIDADFYAFSGHKVFGPTGIGVLYGKAKLLNAMPPYQGGGDMIRTVTFEKTTYNDIPYKFEAGTPNIAGAIGLGAALDYVENVGMADITAHEGELLCLATGARGAIPGVRIVGTSPQKAGVISFVVEGVHAHDVATVLDREGIAVRAGHHCAQPVMERFGLAATARASFAMYNTIEEVDALARAIAKVKEIFD